ncbi:MAG: hypothetical protein AAF990_12570 [Bacteroidota bacterium]
MKKSIFLSALFACMFCLLQAQETIPPEGEILPCGAEPLSDAEVAALPWWGDFDNLEIVQNAYMDSLSRRALDRSRNGCLSYQTAETALFYAEAIPIPVSLYFYQEDSIDGLDLPSEANIQAMLDYTNSLMEATGFRLRLYLFCTKYITSTQYVDIDGSGELDGMMGAERNLETINVHVVRGSNGWGGVYNRSHDGIALLRNTVSGRSETLLHELGHYFTLPHTHRSTNMNPRWGSADGLNVQGKREAVSRFWEWDGPHYSNCNGTGDGFCDTPADPAPLPAGTTVTAVDFQGVPFAPDRSNAMSYYFNGTTFTRQQILAMWANVLGRFNSYWWGIYAGSVLRGDEFEPDNSELQARLLNGGDSQIHSIHDGCNIDSDWYLINPFSALGNYKITIEKVNKSDCDLPVDIANVSYIDPATNQWASFPGASITQTNDLITILIPCEDVRQYELYLEVSRTSQKENGYYKISATSEGMHPELVVDNWLCSGNIASINNLPAGATVSWLASSSIQLSGNSGSQVTIDRVVPNVSTYFIRATITLGNCSMVIRREFEYRQPEPGNIALQGIIHANSGSQQLENINYIRGNTFSVILSTPGATRHEWSLQSGSATWSSSNNGSRLEVRIPENGYAIFTLNIRVGCISHMRSIYFIPTRNWYRVSPNPTGGEIRIEAIADFTLYSDGTDPSVPTALVIAPDITQVRLFSTQFTGPPVEFTFPEQTKVAQIDLSGYDNGLYLIEVGQVDDPQYHQEMVVKM